MNPYALRFEIFKEAQTLILEKYHCEKEKNDSVEFPDFRDIENLANRINAFVSQDKPVTEPSHAL